MEMEFWGVEVKSGEPLKCDPGEHTYVHLSQVALGEIKKDKLNENVPIYVKVDDKKLVIGTLSTEKCTQVSLDLIFEKEFELSHGWKNGSVYFCGYKSIPEDEEDDEDSDSGPEDLIPLVRNENGKPDVKDEQPKLVIDKAKPGKPDGGLVKAKPKDDEDDDDSDEDDDDEDESDDEDEDEEMQSVDESDDDGEEEDDSSDEETPEKSAKGKKRSQESAMKTPGPGKKAKLVSPEGGKTGATEGKMTGGHVATPYPSKTAGKTPGGEKAKHQTPNSQAKKSGQVTCKSCSKTFNSEQGLESHTKAKHSASAK